MSPSPWRSRRFLTAVIPVGENLPFIIGPAGGERYFTVMAEGALASKLRSGAK